MEDCKCNPDHSKETQERLVRDCEEEWRKTRIMGIIMAPKKRHPVTPSDKIKYYRNKHFKNKIKIGEQGLKKQS